MCDECVRCITQRVRARAQRRPRLTGPADRYRCRVSKRRIDSLLAERGLAPSRSGAATSVRAGRVRIGRDGPLATKPSQLVAETTELVLEARPRYVSRGGEKLEHALETLSIDVRDLWCLDVGASTGGFTDCLLQRGAERVIALDVGFGQLDWDLRNDPRVTVIERTNARGLTEADLPYAPQLTTVDVSFISLAKVLPAIARCLADDGEVLALVKPQFELDRALVGKGGVVREAASRREALVRAAEAARVAGLHPRAFAPSGVLGPKGNRETFLWCSRAGPELADVEAAAREVEPG
jgi:23S rRNA (cytidine1920-2'-O)/16S rRNA (cytidine1409-2'-O)-methyltransferase